MLTRKQLDLLEFIHKRMQQDGVPPSFDEMKEALDLRSKSGIHRLITALEERGFIRRLAHRARAIEIVKLPEALGTTASVTPRALEAGDTPGTPAVTELPLMGRIAAGSPIQELEDTPPPVTVPTGMLSGTGRHYALEVKGDSMIGAGINNGDVVVIRETSHAQDGDIVVAQIEGYEATLKKIYRKRDMICLEAANPAFPTRELPEGSVSVQGRLVGLIRTY